MTVCGKYLAIFGGRNDQIYPIIKNVALNDLHLYDLTKKQWTQVALYGDLACSRWGQSMATINNKKILLLGGMDLSSYAPSVTHEIYIGKLIIPLSKFAISNLCFLFRP